MECRSDMQLNVNVKTWLDKADPMTQIRKAFDDAGVIMPRDLEMDGEIHRFHANPEKGRTNLSGWYVFFDGEYPVGVFGDHTRDLRVAVNTHGSVPFTAEEARAREENIRMAQEKARAERARAAEKAAKECRELWYKAAECTGHPYLEKKGLKEAYGARILGDKLLIPMYAGGELVNLQSIGSDGSKLYHKGATSKGAYYQIGEGKPAYMAEGFATAASVYEATGRSCVVAFSAGNLKNMAEIFPDVTVVADNDESGTGEREAKATGLPYILIPQVGYDANDYMTEHGINALKQVLEPKEPSLRLFAGQELLNYPAPKSWIIKGWLPKGPAFCMTFGPSGNGKTFVVVDRMLSIATGQKEWCGCKVNQADVLYLCGEGSIDVRARIAVWCQEHGITRLEHFYMSEEAAHVDSDEGMARILQALEFYDFKPDLIVIDTLNRFMEGDENDTQNAGTFISACARLQSIYSACLLLVHHTGLAEDAQKRARGSSAFRGALDMQDMVTKAGEVFCIQQTKNKGGREMEPVYLQLEDHDIAGWMDEDGEQVRCAILVPCEDPEEAETVQIRDRNKEKMVEMFVRYGMESGELLIVKRDHLKKAFLEEVMERNPDVKSPQQTADMNLKRALDPLLDDGSLGVYEKDISGRVVSYKTAGFKAFGDGLLEPFFSWNLSRKQHVTTCNN